MRQWKNLFKQIRLADRVFAAHSLRFRLEINENLWHFCVATILCKETHENFSSKVSANMKVQRSKQQTTVKKMLLTIIMFIPMIYFWSFYFIMLFPASPISFRSLVCIFFLKRVDIFFVYQDINGYNKICFIRCY